MQPRLDGIAPPSESAFGLAGVAVAQLDGDFGLEGAALVAGQSPGPRSDEGVGALARFFHGGGPDWRQGAQVIGSGQGNSNRGIFPLTGRLSSAFSRRIRSGRPRQRSSWTARF